MRDSLCRARVPGQHSEPRAGGGWFPPGVREFSPHSGPPLGTTLLPKVPTDSLEMSLDNLFEEILVTEQKALEKRQFLKGVKSEIIRCNEKLRDITEDLHINKITLESKGKDYLIVDDYYSTYLDVCALHNVNNIIVDNPLIPGINLVNLRCTLLRSELS